MDKQETLRLIGLICKAEGKVLDELVERTCAQIKLECERKEDEEDVDFRERAAKSIREVVEKGEKRKAG